MHTVVVEPHEWSPPTEEGQRHLYAAAPPDDARLIEPPSRLVTPDGRLIAAQVPLAGALSPTLSWLTRALDNVRWDGTATNGNEFRLSGFNNAHRTFGYSAPAPLRRRYGCSSCGFNREHPDVASTLEDLSSALFGAFQSVAPEEAAAHKALVEGAIHEDWRFGGAPWTSGIINRSAALPYHRDSGNLSGAWSAMLVLRRGMGGGILHMPELDLYLTIPDKTIVIFDGQGAWHGVTPLTPDKPQAHRYSIVWYAKETMRECIDRKHEPGRAAARAAEATDAAAARLAES